MTNKTSLYHKLIGILTNTYPDNTTTMLNSKTHFELLIAVMLSAQSTDRQVNKITARLFERYYKPQHFARLQPEQLEPLIKGCGLYKNKSRNIIKTSQILINKHNSRVPSSLEELVKLPGVGRKTANVVLNIAFGQPTMPVDTHVSRVTRRLGLAYGATPEQIEKELLDIVPPEQRGDFHHRIIEHGRTICRARKPLCQNCVFTDFCSHYKN